jgi:hypothetical protein
MEAADHGADLVVINVWEHTLLPPAGSVSVSERYVPDPSQTTAEDLLQVIKEELGEEPPVLVQPHVKQGRPAGGEPVVGVAPVRARWRVATGHNGART